MKNKRKLFDQRVREAALVYCSRQLKMAAFYSIRDTCSANTFLLD